MSNNNLINLCLYFMKCTIIMIYIYHLFLLFLFLFLLFFPLFYISPVIIFGIFYPKIIDIFFVNAYMPLYVKNFLEKYFDANFICDI